MFCPRLKKELLVKAALNVQVATKHTVGGKFKFFQNLQKYIRFCI